MSALSPREFLMIPGPTPVPDQVLEEHAKQPLGHRSQEFSVYVKQAVEDLKWLTDTESDPLILTASGTGAMDAAVANTINRGDKVLSLVCGVFGERFAKIAEAYGAEVDRITVPHGEAIDPSSVEEMLSKDRDRKIKAVTVTHNETSTGVINDLESIASIINQHGALSLVDAVTSCGAAKVDIEGWKLDVVVAGSQKALMLPPGLAVVYVGKRAWQAYEQCSNGRFYLDFERYRKAQSEKGMTPFTPNVSLVRALTTSIGMMRESGMDAIYERHERLRSMLRKAVESMGLTPLVAREHASPTVTSIRCPEGFTVAGIRARLKDDYRIIVADGQENLKGKIFRIGHMGYVFDRDIGMTIKALERIFDQSLKTSAVR